MTAARRLSVAFAGTPPFAATTLRALLLHGRAGGADVCGGGRGTFELCGVLTAPDRRSGRGRKKVTPSAVKALALEHQLPVLQPRSLKRGDGAAEALAQVAEVWQPDVLVVAAYGLILPPRLLATPQHGCINVHASLLPRWRGAAPIERAIEARDAETGVTIMAMDEGCDTGAVFCRERYPLGARGATCTDVALGRPVLTKRFTYVSPALGQKLSGGTLWLWQGRTTRWAASRRRWPSSGRRRLCARWLSCRRRAGGCRRPRRSRRRA
jgi:methionyl-tRNA formyltransferase